MNTITQNINIFAFNTKPKVVDNKKRFKPKTGRKLITGQKVNNIKSTFIKPMHIKEWGPELINGRCAMLGYVSGYGYEFSKQ